MDIEKTADFKCISRFLVEKWHVDQTKMKITVSPLLMVYHHHLMAGHMRIVQLVPLHRARITLNYNRRNEVPAFLLDRQPH